MADSLPLSQTHCPPEFEFRWLQCRARSEPSNLLEGDQASCEPIQAVYIVHLYVSHVLSSEDELTRLTSSSATTPKAWLSRYSNRICRRPCDWATEPGQEGEVKESETGQKIGPDFFGDEKQKFQPGHIFPEQVAVWKVTPSAGPEFESLRNLGSGARLELFLERKVFLESWNSLAIEN